MSCYNDKIALGTVQFGINYGISNTHGKTNANEVNDILTFAKEVGINTLDTAYAYGDSEQVIGNIPISNDYKIITKYSGSKGVDKEFKDSIDRLKQRMIYGYLFHNFGIYLNDTQSFASVLWSRISGLWGHPTFAIVL